MPREDGSKGAEASGLAGARATLAKERAQYEAKKENYEGLEEKLVVDFEAGLDASLSDDDRDVLLGGDVLEIAKMIDAKRQVFIGDKLDDEKAELEAFEEALEKKEMQLEDLEAEQTFIDENPDMDVEGFAAFMKGKVAPDDREEMLAASEGDKVKFLGLMAEKYLESTGAANPEDPELPTDISDVPGEGGDVDLGDGDEGYDDFEDAMGMNR